MLHEKGGQFSLQNAWFVVSKLKNLYFFWRVVLNLPQIMKVNLLVRVKCVFQTHVRQFCVQAINFQWKYTYFYFLTLSLSSWNCPAGDLVFWLSFHLLVYTIASWLVPRHVSCLCVYLVSWLAPVYILSIKNWKPITDMDRTLVS